MTGRHVVDNYQYNDPPKNKKSKFYDTDCQNQWKTYCSHVRVQSKTQTHTHNTCYSVVCCLKCKCLLTTTMKERPRQTDRAIDDVHSLVKIQLASQLLLLQSVNSGIHIDCQLFFLFSFFHFSSTETEKQPQRIQRYCRNFVVMLPRTRCACAAVAQL